MVGRSTADYKNLLEDKLTSFLWNEGARMIQIGDDTEILSGYDIACSGNGSVIAGNATYYLGGIDGDGDFLYKNGALSYFEPIADAGIITYVTPDGSKVLKDMRVPRKPSDRSSTTSRLILSKVFKLRKDTIFR